MRLGKWVFCDIDSLNSRWATVTESHMRFRIIWSVCFLAIGLALGGCSKSTSSDKEPPMVIDGVNVDAPNLMAAFLDAPPNLYTAVNDAVTDIRYKEYLPAMKGLDEVLKSPELKPHQKELLDRVMRQLNQVLAKTSPQPGQ